MWVCNAGSGPFPAVLDLLGGQGGRVEYHSALLASHGYVSLALEYIGLLNAAGKLQHMDNTYFEVRVRYKTNKIYIYDAFCVYTNSALNCSKVTVLYTFQWIKMNFTSNLLINLAFHTIVFITEGNKVYTVIYTLKVFHFQTAFTLLKKHPKVCPDKVAVMGMSFGVPVTLGLTAYSEIMEVNAS